MWACSDDSFSKLDERTDQFKYYFYYNPITNLVEKFGKQMPTNLKRCFQFTNFFVLSIIIAGMIVHRYFAQLYKNDKEGDLQ